LIPVFTRVVIPESVAGTKGENMRGCTEKTGRERSVSEVIGVILTVALVIVMAGLVAAFMTGMIGAFPKNKEVALTLQTNNSGGLVVTVAGGADVTALRNITIMADGAEDSSYEGVFTAGQQICGRGSPAVYVKKDIAIVGRFSDGTVQVLVKKGM
jgi:archaeal type IV pilus assembly protein PilA